MYSIYWENLVCSRTHSTRAGVTLTTRWALARSFVSPLQYTDGGECVSVCVYAREFISAVYACVYVVCAREWFYIRGCKRRQPTHTSLYEGFFTHCRDRHTHAHARTPHTEMKETWARPKVQPSLKMRWRWCGGNGGSVCCHAMRRPQPVRSPSHSRRSTLEKENVIRNIYIFLKKSINIYRRFRDYVSWHRLPIHTFVFAQHNTSHHLYDYRHFVSKYADFRMGERKKKGSVKRKTFL